MKARPPIRAGPSHDAAAYYNVVNRLADGLGVELEPDWTSHPKEAER